MRKTAYLMSRFPKITETFVLYEIAALVDLGRDIAIFPLMKTREEITHPEVRSVMERVRPTPWVSARLICANLRALIRSPLRFITTLAQVLRGSLPRPSILLKSVAIFPKSVFLAEIMKREGIEHVHAHFATHPATAALIIHQLTGIPFSFTVHSHDIQRDRSLLGPKIAEASFVISISAFNRRSMAAEAGTHLAKIHVLHCGTDPEAFPWRRRPLSGTEPLQIVCVAMFIEVKGHRYLLRAGRLLEQRGLDFRCHLVGDGPLREEIRAETEALGLETRVIRHGVLARPEVQALLDRCDVAVLPCVTGRDGNHDGIPVALMEAMASGLAVISTTLSGIPELIEDGISGLLVPPGDFEALADAIERVVADPGLRERLGTAARRRILESFDLRENARRLAGLIDGASFGVEAGASSP